MKLLIDMNLSPRWASLLADAGIEAVHWSAVGAANASDPEIAALWQMRDELEKGALVTIDPNRTRLRLLPLQPR